MTRSAPLSGVPTWRSTVSRAALRVLLCGLGTCLVACSSPGGDLDASAREGGANETTERGFTGPVPVPVETRDGDYKIASGGYAEYVQRGFKPRSDLEAYVIRLPFDWAKDPFRDNNWRFQLQAWRMLNPMWGEYRASGSPEVLEEILAVIRDWHRFHVLEARPSSYQWQDMATGLRAQHVAYLNHLVTTGKWKPSTEDARMLDALGNLHARTLHDDAYISINNHGIFQIHGLRMLCNSAPSLEPCRGEPGFSAEHMRQLIETQFDEHGVHREDSSFYHLFAYKTFRGIRMSLYPGLSRDALRRVRLAEGVTPWLTGLDGKLLQFGDSEGEGVPFKRPADAGRCWSVTPEGLCMVARDMRESGYVAVRSVPGTDADKGALFFVVGSSHDAGHDHADELGFFLSHRGTPVFVDGGKYGYQDNPQRAYFLSDRAHNVVGLEGVSFKPGQTEGEGSYLEAFQQRDGVYEVSGQVQRGGHFTHRRTFRYVPGSSLEIRDRIAKPAKSRLELRYVFAPDLTVDEDAGTFRVTDADGRGLATMSLPGAASCNAAVVRGRKQPEYAGWISTSYLVVEPTTNLVVNCPPQVTSLRTLVELH